MTTTLPSQPLSPAQHGMWVTEQVLGPGAAHHLALTVRFPAPPDPEVLAAGCARLLERQPVLCSRVDPDGPALVPAAGPAPVLRRLTCAPGELDALLAEESTRPFDLTGGPLVRFALVTAGADPGCCTSSSTTWSSTARRKTCCSRRSSAPKPARGPRTPR